MLTLNEKPLATWYDGGNAETFKLEGFDDLHAAWDWAKTLEGQDLTIKQDGTARKVYGGYSVTDVGIDENGLVVVRAQRALDPDTAAAIEALEANVATAQETAEAAMETAQEAGADPQVATIAKLTAPSIDFEAVSATDCVAIPDYTPEWEPGIKLGKNAPVMRNGQLYRASQAIESAKEQYPPETAGESLYYPVEVAPDGIIVYRTCHGEYDMVRKGEKRHYPGAGDPVYLALEDTAYSPDAYPQHWELDQAEAE